MRTFLLACALAMASPLGAQSVTDDPATRTLERLQAALQAGDRNAFDALFDGGAAELREEFAESLFIPGVIKTTVHERERRPLEGAPPGDGYQLVAEFFIETAARARILTVSLELRRPDGGDGDSWRIVGGEGLTSIDGLYRLRVSTTSQFIARDLTVDAEDLLLTLQTGAVFPVEGEDGITGLVLIGRGQMRFAPTPVTEKGQLRIFSGAETLSTSFETAFVRVNPADYQDRVAVHQLVPSNVDARLLRQAQEVFAREGPKSFSLDLEDLSPDVWHLLPPQNDFLAEVQTRRWGTLTYSRSGQQAEDITLFSRERNRTISMYASQAKIAARGRFYSDDELLEYDVLDYNIEAQVVPTRQSIEGRARLLLRLRAGGTNTLTVRLADPLVVSSVVSLEYGRLLHLRIRGQNSILINLPGTFTRDTDITLVITYSGQLPPQELEREALRMTQQAQPQFEDFPAFVAEPNYLLSSRSYWYPQNPITEYATATIRLTVPPGYGVAASGEPAGTSREVTLRDLLNLPSGQSFVFRAQEPVRYLAMVVSRFTRVADAVATLPEPDGRPRRGAPHSTIGITVEANPRLQGRGRELLPRVEDIMRFYTSVVGDAPYTSVTVALVESELPGGHSPAYFAVVNSPLPVSNNTSWRSDPASFGGFPDFFLAHELAHQWWGQAVGWKNYHEQWLSEGFAQYFAALYAQRTRGEETFVNMLRQFRRWTLAESDEGPVHLGYRLGHIKDDGRVFRALVYNKAAGVLHMLRRWLGDEVFFNAVRRFYDEQRFRKAGTDDLRRAFEDESGRSLERFFDRWILGAELPLLRVSSTVQANEVVVNFEQLTPQLFDVPVTVNVTYRDGRTEEVVVAVTEQTVTRRIQTAGAVRRVQINRDGAALARFEER